MLRIAAPQMAWEGCAVIQNPLRAHSKTGPLGAGFGSIFWGRKEGKMKPSVIPVLRMFNLDKAKEFYCEFLGWKIDWSHTFGENFPVFMQISNGLAIIQLSEHYGDACPGSTIKISVENIEEMALLLKAKEYKYSKPGVETMPWKTKEMWIHDPFGNKIMFVQDIN